MVTEVLAEWRGGAYHPEICQKSRQREQQVQELDCGMSSMGLRSWDEVRECHGHIYTLPNVKEIASGKQPHSTGRSARCFVTT